MTPTAEAVREQLDRILSADTFAGAGRHSRLLRYVVERTLAGEGDQLKEYTLATDVFDRPETYDPRLDSIVRVEVRRLRSRLEEYYAGPGAGDPVLIAIPRGTYVPEFSTRNEDNGRQESDRDQIEASAQSSPKPATRRGAWLVIASALAAALLVAVMRLQPEPSSSAHAATGPAIAVLPFESYSTSPEEQLLAARLTDAVAAELASLGGIAVASRTTTAQYAREGRSAAALAEALGVQFVVEASAPMEGEVLKVMVRLVDAPIERKVWVGEYDVAPAELSARAARIASDMAAAALAYRSAR